MSWDASLVCDCCRSTIIDTNYTHNTNRMIELALGDAVEDTGAPWFASDALGHRSWWKLLDGLSGADGAALLHRIITGLEADPAEFRAMNPENGWGDYDELLVVLRQMRAATPEFKTVWQVGG